MLNLALIEKKRITVWDLLAQCLFSSLPCGIPYSINPILLVTAKGRINKTDFIFGLVLLLKLEL
jgi:hypothetical protein